MFNFNKKKKIETLIEFYQNIKVDQSNFVLFNINKNYVKSSNVGRELNITNANITQGLRIGLLENKVFQEAFQNTSILYQNEIVKVPEVQKNFNQLIDELLQFTIKDFTTTLNQPAEVSAINQASEEKALEWLRVSFEVLTKAHVDLLKKNLEYPAYSLFFGKNPQTTMPEIRITIFNLDITYQLLNDKNLRVIVFNDHGNAFGTSKTPALKGDFSIRKREMFNLLIELLIELKKSFHI